MFFIIGFITVIVSVMGGYAALGGHLSVLWQPFEYVIIFGAGIGSFIIANPKTVLGGAVKSMGSIIKGPQYKKAHYTELLSVLYSVFKLAKKKGDLALETHVENPSESPLFESFPLFAKDHHSVEFLCDYLRMLTMGTSNSHEMENILDQELEIHHEEKHAIVASIQTLADGFPALGIVAAVLGVIHTMGSITEPPEVLGHLIGGALVGTFSGIFISYGFVASMASSLGSVYNADSHYFLCIKTAIIAHMQGYAPQVSVEFARKTLAGNMRPSFKEVEDMLEEVPSFD